MKSISKPLSIAISLGVGVISGSILNNYLGEVSHKNVLKEYNIANIDNFDNIVGESKALTVINDDGEKVFLLYNTDIMGNIINTSFIEGDEFLIYRDKIINVSSTSENVKSEALSKENNYIERSSGKDNNISIEKNDTQNSVVYDSIKMENTSTNKANRNSAIDGSIDAKTKNSDENKKNQERTDDTVEIKENKGISSLMTGNSAISSLKKSNNETTKVKESEVVELDSLILNDNEALDEEPFDINIDEIISKKEKSNVSKVSENNRVVDELVFVDNNIDKEEKELTKEEKDIKKRVQEVAEKNYRREAIKKISDRLSSIGIEYKSELKEEKRVLTVFTDPTCPFCRRLHGDIERLQLNGYTIRYLLIPKDGMSSSIVNELAKVSCSPKEKQKELTNELFRNQRVSVDVSQNCTSNIISRQLSVARNLGANNTPFIIDNKGGISQGYSNMENMIESLDESNKIK